MNSRQEFCALLASEPVDLGHVALLAVQIMAADSATAIAATAQARAELGVLVEQASAAGCAESVEALVDFLGSKQGFRGNSGDYYATDNSNLAHVLRHKSGIPITLALVYIHVGGALGFDLRGVGFPGHFLVGVYAAADSAADQNGLPPQEIALIDPFFGALITRAECIERLQAMQGGNTASGGPVSAVPAAQLEQWFRPASAVQVSLRLLENLKQIHLQAGESGPALAALELQLLVAPDQFELRTQHEALLAQAFGRGSDPQVH